MQFNRPRRPLLLSILSSATLLTACGDKTPPQTVGKIVVREHYTAVTPDERLRSCPDRPARRAINNSNDVALVIEEAFAYGDDCKSKHDATWKSIDDAKARADKLNKDPQ